MLDTSHIQLALNEAKQALAAGEIPIGAVIVDDKGQVIATAFNQKETNHDPTAHAEILTIRQATQKLENWRLAGCTLYVTLEPCPMCLSAIVQARVSKLVFGAADPVMGACGSKVDLASTHSANPIIEITGGVLAEECKELIDDFWRARRGCLLKGEVKKWVVNF